MGLGDSSLQLDLQLRSFDVRVGSHLALCYIQQMNSGTNFSWWQHHKHCFGY